MGAAELLERCQPGRPFDRPFGHELKAEWLMALSRSTLLAASKGHVKGLCRIPL